MNTTNEDLRKAFGRNARELRKAHQIRVEVVAREAKRNDLSYSPGRVSDLESGRVEVKLDTVARYAQVMANVTGQPVALADLFDGTPLADLLRGVPVEPDPQVNAGLLDTVRRLGWESLQQAADEFRTGPAQDKLLPYLQAYEEAGQADRRAAKQLNLSLVELVRRAVGLWGCNLTEQRDRTAGDERNPAQLGLVTTELVAQIREALQ